MESATSPLRFCDLTWGIPGYLSDGVPPLFQGLDLQLEPGKWTALTGPSGTGKTTLLSIAAGLLQPTAGRVELFGIDLSALNDAALAGLRANRLGLIFQNYHLDDCRTAKENVLLAGFFCDRGWHGLDKRASSLLARLGLGGFEQKPVSVLSGGQRQRVAVARALLNEPELILADEPTGALDRETAESVLEVLSETVDQGAALFTVTHSGLLLERADKAYSFLDGRLEVAG